MDLYWHSQMHGMNVQLTRQQIGNDCERIYLGEAIHVQRAILEILEA